MIYEREVSWRRKKNLARKKNREPTLIQFDLCECSSWKFKLLVVAEHFKEQNVQIYELLLALRRC